MKQPISASVNRSASALAEGRADHFSFSDDMWLRRQSREEFLKYGGIFITPEKRAQAQRIVNRPFVLGSALRDNTYHFFCFAMIALLVLGTIGLIVTGISALMFALSLAFLYGLLVIPAILLCIGFAELFEKRSMSAREKLRSLVSDCD